MCYSLMFVHWYIQHYRVFKIEEIFREEGPQEHQKKAGTPTMGGVLIVLSTAVPPLLWADLTNPFILLSLFALLGFAVIGFIDDYAKVSKQRNLGLTVKKKIYFQVFLSLVGGVSLLVLTTHSAYSTQLMIPFLKRFRPDLVFHSLMHSPHFWPLAFIPFLVFVGVVIVGSSYAVNLTDGLDGLAIGCTVIPAGALTVLTHVSSNYPSASYLDLHYTPKGAAMPAFSRAPAGQSVGRF